MSGDPALSSPEPEAVEIRPVTAIDDFHACEGIQRLAWGFRSDLDVVPLTQLVAATKAGGVVLGAFREDGSMSGFCYGFPGRDARGELHYSHMTAVDPGVKASGIGARLKWAQRDAVRARGVERIVWTYDPLESLNGYFNFTKLGVVVRQYWENLYGETGSALHAGTPTDRFLAEWELGSERVGARAAGEPGTVAVQLAAAPDRVPAALVAIAGSEPLRPAEPDLGREESRLTVRIPGSIQDIKRDDPELALEWRLVTRAVFTHYLERGWLVRECVRTGETPSRTLYLLDREET